ncbi:MAG TPA: cardiolipin synthase ClsB [Burkholderiales bacterium]|nr:cardiolipin synthase ClsB [Burkholderiales bacterium]
MSYALVPGNRITLLRSGVEYFPALEAAIRAARREIYLESYLYEADETGWRITNALADAARRGVAVHVLVDGFGAKAMPPEMVQALARAGAERLVYRPEISPFRIRKYRLRRMHRKLVAIDGAVAFVGGINVIDDFGPDGRGPPRLDFAVRIEGPLLRPIQEALQRLWTRVAWVRLHRRRRAKHRVQVDDAPKGAQAAAFVVRDNFRHRSDIEDAYLAAIDAARDEILIANAYFFPGTRFRRALLRAAGRGVRVTLLLQGKIEYTLQHYASRALYGALLQSGVEIYEYHKSYLHAKVAVIDGHWATVGSSNIDPFSLLLAREANVVVEDRDFAAELRLALHAALEDGSLVIEGGRWFRLPLWRRIPMWVSYAIGRFIMGMVGFGGQV